MINAPQSFHDKARGQIIEPIAKLYISFSKEPREGTYFTLNQSQLNGDDLIGSSEDNPLQLWDLYAYQDYSDRLTNISVERSIEFPYNTQYAMGDFTLDNFDKYFSPRSNSPIAQYNIPQRPVKIFAGFIGETLIPQFVGLTEDVPDTSTNVATAEFHATDFLSAIYEQVLVDTIIARDVTTDVLLAKIVEQFGVLPSQYNFEKGDNVIPFAFFDVGSKAGDAIKDLIQAEGGKFWLDEQGILRFMKRNSLPTNPVMSIDDYSIASIATLQSANIVNKVVISCDLREVQEYQSVYSKAPSATSTTGDMWVVGANDSITRDCKLSDPCYEIVNPTQGRQSTVSWFTAVDSFGNTVNSGVTAVGVLSTTAYTITFTNNNNFPVKINEIQLWGEPAKVYDHLEYEAEDTDSVEKYGEQVLTINDNKFFQSYHSARAFARYILREYANYIGGLRMSIKGDPSLQLMDTISIEEGDYAGLYKIDTIKWELGVGSFETNIDAHKVEPVYYFTLNESQLNGTHVLA